MGADHSLDVSLGTSAPKGQLKIADDPLQAGLICIEYAFQVRSDLVGHCAFEREVRWLSPQCVARLRNSGPRFLQRMGIGKCLDELAADMRAAAVLR